MFDSLILGWVFTALDLMVQYGVWVVGGWVIFTYSHSDDGWSSRGKVMLDTMTGVYAPLVGGKFVTGFKHIIVSLCLLILAANLGALVPGVVGWTGQIVFPLLMAISMWGSIIGMSLYCDWSCFFSNLTPEGSPLSICFLLVWVEMVSNLIRPFTLSMRLLVNMIAGHIFLWLAGIMCFYLFMNLMFLKFGLMMFCLMVLTGAEMAVCLFQSYVFGLLLGVYAQESRVA